jgi:polar amino acid transport system permease protein
MGVRSLAAILALTIALIAVLGARPQWAVFMPGLLEGTRITIMVAVLGSALAVVAGLAAGIARLYAPAPIRWLASTYVEVFRGTSALVQLFWLFFVLPQFGVSLEPFTVAVLGLGLNVGAYGSEVVRGAIQAVPRGQWEASTALNMTRPQMLRRIILPQAFVAMVPPWGNLFIELLKSTALVSLITLGDLAFRAQQMNQTTMRTIPIFTLVLLIYLALSLLITIGMRSLEGWLGRGQARGRGAH